MGAIINASFNVAKLPKEKFVKGKDGAVWYNLTIAINDDTRYGNNVALMDSRTKEERDAGKAPLYLGNGKVNYINDLNDDGLSGTIRLVEKEDKQNEVVVEGSSADLPF